MSDKTPVEDKAEQAREATIPESFTKEYSKFLRAAASESDPESLDALQVKFRLMMIKMSSLKVYVPPAWSDAHNACGERAARVRADEFRRRMQ